MNYLVHAVNGHESFRAPQHFFRKKPRGKEFNEDAHFVLVRKLKSMLSICYFNLAPAKQNQQKH